MNLMSMSVFTFNSNYKVLVSKIVEFINVKIKINYEQAKQTKQQQQQNAP